MSLEDELKYLAEGLREYDVPSIYGEDLRALAEKVGELEWRLEDLEH